MNMPSPPPPETSPYPEGHSDPSSPNYIPDEQLPNIPYTTYWQHGWDKCKQQPFVPIGVAATTAALLMSAAALKAGNSYKFQIYMRMRVAAQGLTVLGMVAGAFMWAEKNEEIRKEKIRSALGYVPPPRPEVDEHAELYPPREKVKVSDFAHRLRRAEQQHAEDEAIGAAEGQRVLAEVQRRKAAKEAEAEAERQV